MERFHLNCMPAVTELTQTHFLQYRRLGDVARKANPQQLIPENAARFTNSTSTDRLTVGDFGDLPAGQILMVTEVLAGRYKDVESCSFSGVEKFAVRESVPLTCTGLFCTCQCTPELTPQMPEEMFFPARSEPWLRRPAANVRISKEKKPPKRVPAHLEQAKAAVLNTGQN